MMTCRRRLPASSLVIALVLVLAGTATAQEYMPLRPESNWSYDVDAGGERTATVTGVMTVLGAETVEILNVITGTDAQTYRNYWSAGPEGDVYLHRAVNENTSFDATYDPPILFLDAPLVSGKSWSTTTSIGGDTVTAAYEVGEIESVLVPAGRFDCHPVSSTVTVPAKDGVRHDVFGRRTAPGDKTEPARYYTVGVGLVKEYFGYPGSAERLNAWTIPTPAVQRSWGLTKSLYR